MKYPKIKYVEPLENYKLFLIFNNGVMKEYSMLNLIETTPFKPLHNVKLFNAVKIDSAGYGIIWNDELDLSEYELWQNSREISSIKKIMEASAT